MNSNRSCSAWFEPEEGGSDTVSLTLSIQGIGSLGSSVGVTPGATGCPGSCVGLFVRGTALSLQATPGEYSLFVQWGGSCSNGAGDSTNPKTMVINEPETCNAVFACHPDATATECPGD